MPHRAPWSQPLQHNRAPQTLHCSFLLPCTAPVQVRKMVGGEGGCRLSVDTPAGLNQGNCSGVSKRRCCGSHGRCNAVNQREHASQLWLKHAVLLHWQVGMKPPKLTINAASSSAALLLQASFEGGLLATSTICCDSCIHKTHTLCDQACPHNTGIRAACAKSTLSALWWVVFMG